jgi:carbonic anhydrase/acetyltransferase-like protein (isoleucine patch superfamily)/acyl carrier protein
MVASSPATTLYLCGAGNPEGVRLALMINSAAERWKHIFLLDDDPSKHGSSVLGVDVLGSFDELANADAERSEVANLVARSTAGRWACRRRIESFGVPFTALVHPDIETLGAQLPTDLIAYRNAILSAGSTIGEGSVVFSGAVVGHGSTLGRGCVLAPGAVTNARALLGDRAYMGTNSSVLPELEIGEGATVGANSAVMHDVPAGATAMGVPAEIFSVEKRTGPSATPRSPRPEPSCPTAESVSAIWRDVLDQPAVSVGDNFFDLGGTSLLALQIKVRIHQDIGFDLSLTDIFRFPTIGGLALHIDGQGAGRPGRGHTSIAQQRAAIRRSRLGA